MRVYDFQKLLRQKSVDVCVLANCDPSVFYFAGVEIEHCLAFVPSSGKPVLLVSGLEAERASVESGFSVQSYTRPEDRGRLISGLLGGERIGVNKPQLSVKDFEHLRSFRPNSEFVDVSSEIAAIRQIKSSGEISLLRDACSETDKIISRCISGFDFRTELSVRNFLEAEVRRIGCRVSFETIVASGSNASMPHYSGSGKLQNGFCVIDFGIRKSGYCSDITRTIYLGSPSQGDRDAYGLVLSAQESAIAMARQGVEAGELDAAARSALGRHRDFFIHGLGHHIGVEVHDAGFRIAEGVSEKLQAGMAITIEPGIYYRGRFGIRIEDDVLITKDGCELLTRAPKGFVSVPCND